ncbi:hypothetical protein HYDPIDRAFT_100291, partial [Hydnomerulius pinastri MD-312]
RMDLCLENLFASRNLSQAHANFTSLPAKYHPMLIGKLTHVALGGTEADAHLVGDLFAQLSKEWCSPEAFERGIISEVEALDDIVLDVPRAFEYMAIILKGAGLDKEDGGLSRIASKSINGRQVIRHVILGT